MTTARFRMTTAEVSRELARSAATLRRFRQAQVLRPGQHFIAKGTSTTRPWLVWDPDATRIALEQHSRRNLR